MIYSTEIVRKRFEGYLCDLDIYHIRSNLKLHFSLNLPLETSLNITHLCPFSKGKFNLYEAENLTTPTLLYRLVLLIVFFINPMSVQCSTNWDRKGWPGSEIQMYYGSPCNSLTQSNTVQPVDEFQVTFYLHMFLLNLCL